MTQPTWHSGSMFLVTVILPTTALKAFEQQIWIAIADGSVALPSCPNLKSTGLKIRLLDPSVKMMKKWKIQSGQGIHLLAIQEHTFQTQRNSPLGQGFIVSSRGSVVSSKTVKQRQRIATEIHNAEMIAVRKSQKDSFHLDIEALRANKWLPVRSRLSTLNPYVDEAECLRVGGCLRKAPVPEETWHPLILDPKQQITRLIVMHNYHRLHCTSNKNILNDLRQKYWILKGLAMVQNISSSCPSCRRLRAKPEPPVMAGLPDSRLGCQQPPFTNTRVDTDTLYLKRVARKS